MLRWSSNAEGQAIDVDTIEHPALVHADLLRAFAIAACGVDDSALTAARQHLLNSAGYETMVDAAAIIANFEMMTRVADGTGARHRGDRVTDDTALVTALGLTGLPSRR